MPPVSLIIHPPVMHNDPEPTFKIRHGFRLPHWTQDGAIYATTFRLADSIPQTVLKAWASERDELERQILAEERPLTKQEEARRKRLLSAEVQRYLDAGYGSCWMNDEQIACLISNALKFFDNKRYVLHAWCVMPNHVHTVVEPLASHTISSILQSWKSFTSKEANKVIRRSGVFWQAESYDHMVRDEADYDRCVEYA